jgi:hypothetical protein
MLFEAAFIGLYAADGPHFGDVCFFDVRTAPPYKGRPSKTMSFDEVIQAIDDTYNARNSPVFVWADADPEPVTSPVVNVDGDDEDDDGPEDSPA